MELRDYLNVISARRWVIIQAIVIVTVTALVISFVQPKVYEGQAKVLISEKDTGAALLGTLISEFSSQPERGLQTQAQLMTLRPLAEQTIRDLGLKMSPDALLEDVTVSAVGQTNVVMVSVVAQDPQTAADIANTMAEGYVEWSKETKRESIRAAADEVEVRLGDAQKQILDLGRRIASEGKTDELAAELQLLTGTYSTLAEQLEQLRISEQLETGTGRVVETAVADRHAIAPNPMRNGMLGLIGGIALGLAMALLYEYLDNTVKTDDEAERIFGAPVIGTIPMEKFDKGVKRRLTIVEAPGSSVSESYRVLRNSLDFINFEHKVRSLVITSAAPAEGKSTVAANLAASLSHTGKKVVLVSCDFRRPTTEQFFNVNNIIGLSDVLLGTHSLKAALQRPGDESLLVLSAGKMPPNPSELLGSAKMGSLLDELKEWADWVIIDTPPLLAVADPAAVARWADGVLVVMQAGRSTRDAGRKAVELLENVGARTVGVVVWGLEEGKHSGYGYGHYAGGYYYYSSYYGAKPMAAATGRSASASKESWDAGAPLGRKVAALVGRILAAVLGFAAIVAIFALVLYWLDAFMGWGVVRSILG